MVFPGPGRAVKPYFSVPVNLYTVFSAPVDLQNCMSRLSPNPSRIFKGSVKKDLYTVFSAPVELQKCMSRAPPLPPAVFSNAKNPGPAGRLV